MLEQVVQDSLVVSNGRIKIEIAHQSTSGKSIVIWDRSPRQRLFDLIDRMSLGDLCQRLGQIGISLLNYI